MKNIIMLLALALLALPGCYLSHERFPDLPCDDVFVITAVGRAVTVPIGGEEQVAHFRVTNTGDVGEPFLGCRPPVLEGLFSFPEPATLRIYDRRDSEEFVTFETEISGHGDFDGFRAGSDPFTPVLPGRHVDLVVTVETASLSPAMDMRVGIEEVVFGNPFHPRRTCPPIVFDGTATFARVP